MRPIVTIKGKLLDSLKKIFSNGKKDEYWVRGSGLVHIPRGQLNQIPKVIQEYHSQELRVEKLRLMIRRA